MQFDNAIGIPRYKHDHCKECRFVCQSEGVDVWICHKEDSLIERYGDNLYDYRSISRLVFGSFKNHPDKYKRKYIQIWEKLVQDPSWHFA